MRRQAVGGISRAVAAGCSDSSAWGEHHRGTGLQEKATACAFRIANFSYKHLASLLVFLFIMTLLQNFLAINVAYFCAMSLAHFFSFKYPILFIYYNADYQEYQDKIISFCAATYAILFLAAYNHAVVVPSALSSLIVTVAGLS